MYRRQMIDYIIDHSTEVKDINYYLSLAYLWITVKVKNKNYKTKTFNKLRYEI